MKSRILKILCVAGVCALLAGGTSLLSGDWEKIGQCTAFYYPEEIFYDIKGTPTENTGDCLFGMSFDPKEYNAMKIECEVLMEEGEIEIMTLEDKSQRVIWEKRTPIVSFEEELDKDTFQNFAFVTQQGSKGSQGEVTTTVYGKPKWIAIIKRKVKYMVSLFDFS